MGQDLRSFVEMVKREAPDQFIEIEKAIDSRHEIAAFLQHLENHGKYPMVLFRNVRNVNGKTPSLSVLTNVGATRERIAMAINSTIDRVAHDSVSRAEHPIEPVLVEKDTAPVKEVITRGKEADLFDLPILVHHEMDIGAYITAGDVWTKDPDTGDVNCAMIRIWAREPRKVLFSWAPVRHTNYYYQKYVARKEPMPVAIVIGHHLAFLVGAQTKVLGAELRTIGAMLGEPLELVPSETWGDKFLVPARAEIVIEAEVLPGALDIEAPFGEYTGYYGGQRLGYVGEVRAITRRADAIYHDVFAGHRDHLIMDGPNIEATVLAKLKEVAPTVTNVYLPPSGTCRFHAYVQLRKTDDAEPKSIIATTFTADFRIKHVWVVDDDVDIYDEQQILWAMATRFQGDKDLVMIKDMLGSTLDPSVEEVTSKTTKVGFDCTKPAPPLDYPKRVSISEDILEKVKASDYISEDQINKLF